jgi:hypothetical protein
MKGLIVHLSGVIRCVSTARHECMPYRKPDYMIPGRILSEEELLKIDNLLRDGMTLKEVQKELGFSQMLYMKKSLRMSGYRTGSIIYRKEPHHIKVRMIPEKLSVPELEVVQALLVDDGFSERKVAQLMYDATGRDIYKTHIRFRKALRRSGYMVRQGVIRLDTGGG